MYGQSQEEVVSKVKALALRILADRLEHVEEIPELSGFFEENGWTDAPELVGTTNKHGVEFLGVATK